jgi:hypothetical protein
VATPNAADDVDIFKKQEASIATNFIVMFAGDQQALIAVRQAKPPAPPSDNFFEAASRGARIIQRKFENRGAVRLAFRFYKILNLNLPCFTELSICVKE